MTDKELAWEILFHIVTIVEDMYADREFPEMFEGHALALLEEVHNLLDLIDE